MILSKKHKDVTDYKSCLNFNKQDDKDTHVFLLISHFDSSKNSITRLSCKNLTTIRGYPSSTNYKPVGTGYVYDSVNDTYVISCVEFVSLGLIPFYFTLSLDSVGVWNTTVPIPDKILFRVFDDAQKDKFYKLQSTYPKDHFYFNFVQFLVE